MRSVLVVLTLALAVQAPCVASDKDGGYAIYGAATCAEFLRGVSSPNSSRAVSNLAWMGGYVTAYNLRMRNTYDMLGSTDLEGAELWMNKYCNEHPLDNMAVGMQHLMIELQPKAVTQEPRK